MPTHAHHLTVAWLAQLIERQSAERDVAGSNLGRTKNQSVIITEDEGAAFAVTSANG